MKLRKNLSKIIAIAIGISMISGNVMPVLALDTTKNTQSISDTQVNTNNIQSIVGGQAQINSKPVLTLDEAIKSAIDISEILELDEKKISYTDKINDVNEQIDDNPQLVGKAEISLPENRKDLNEDLREVKLKQCKQQKDFDEDKLIQKVTTDYNNIVANQIKIDKLKKDIDIKNKELDIIKVKTNAGIATTVDTDASSNTLEDLKDKLKSSESALKDAEYSFKNLTDKDVTKYSLEQDIKYDVFKINGSVDEYLDNAVEKYLKYTTQIVKLNKDYFKDDDNKVEDVPDTDKPSNEMPVFSSSTNDPEADLATYEKYEKNLNDYYQAKYMYAFKLSMRLAYLNGKLGTYESETNLNETKKLFKEQLRNFYTMLTTTEDSINLLKKNIELNNKQLRISKVKYDGELITKTDYDHQIVNSEELDIQLRSAIDRYNTLKAQIQKPWIAFSK